MISMKHEEGRKRGGGGQMDPHATAAAALAAAENRVGVCWGCSGGGSFVGGRLRRRGRGGEKVKRRAWAWVSGPE